MVALFWSGAAAREADASSRSRLVRQPVEQGGQRECFPPPCDILNPVIDNHLRLFFWDVNLENFDPHLYPAYTIFRLLEFGDERAIAWLRGEFSQGEIEEVLRTERRLSPRSANFWALVYGVPPEEVAALTRDHPNFRRDERSAP